MTTHRPLDDVRVVDLSRALAGPYAPIVGLDPKRPDIATNVDRVALADALQKEIDALLADRKSDEVLAALDGVGVPAGRIRTIPEVYDWEQVRDTMVLNVPHPTLGDLEMPGSPLQLSDNLEPRADAPPARGAHQDDVFADYAATRGSR